MNKLNDKKDIQILNSIDHRNLIKFNKNAQFYK